MLVEWSQILISDKQVEEIARTMLNGLREIDAFIQEHQTEYERFCAAECESIEKKNKSAQEDTRMIKILACWPILLRGPPG